VLACIEQHIGERAPHLARRAQDPQVIAAVEHRARESERALGRARHPGRDRLHPTPEGLLAGALDEQVQVVALHRVVHDAEATALAGLSETWAQLA
jgi:hypothetical protein